MPQILDLLSHCLAPEPAASSAAELPHLVTGMFRTVFEFTSPESGLPHPTAALLYERITRAGERSLEPGWRGRAQERLARDVEQWLSEASPAPGTKDSFRALGRPGAALRNSLLRRSRLDWSRPGRT